MEVLDDTQSPVKSGSRLFRMQVEIHKAQIHEGIGNAPLVTDVLLDDQALLKVVIGGSVLPSKISDKTQIVKTEGDAASFADGLKGSQALLVVVAGGRVIPLMRNTGA